MQLHFRNSWWWAIISLETCWAVKEQWNNKLSYTVASCWSFLYGRKCVEVLYIAWTYVFMRLKCCTSPEHRSSCGWSAVHRLNIRLHAVEVLYIAWTYVFMRLKCCTSPEHTSSCRCKVCRCLQVFFAISPLSRNNLVLHSSKYSTALNLHRV